METKHCELLAFHRSKLIENVDVEKLLPRFKVAEVLNSQDVEEIRSQSNSIAKMEKFLDILPSKGSNAFATLCLALESTYPHLLTVMFLGSHKHSESKLEVERSEGAIYSSPSAKSNATLLKSELKTVTQERDSLQKQLQKVHAERDFLMQSFAMSNSDPLTRLGSLTKQHASSSSDKSLSAGRDYEWLKCQCEQAMSEVQALRRQHTDTARRCDSAIRESEFYRAKHRQAVNKLDKQQHELQSLRQQYKETLSDKRRLEEDVIALQSKELVDGGHRQKSKCENARMEAINQMNNALVNKYDKLQAEYDSLHKRFTDLLAVRSAPASVQMEINEDEIVELRKRYEDIMEERNNLIRERNGLSQQCTNAIHKWDTTLRELTLTKESLSKVQQQRDEAMKEINQAMAGRIKAAKDLARLTEERNAAVQEYSLVMLERDSVHKEIEKLQEELSEANRRIDGSVKEKKLTLEEVETLRREISSALHDRDRALKECNDLREKYGDFVTGRQDVGEEGRGRREFDSYSRRDSSRKSRSESFGRQDALVGGSSDTPTKHSKDKTVDNLEQANLEIDRLRKNAEKLQDELTDAQQEAEVCKRRRDWAFNERDKIVLERESIRTLCDKLRRERDRAVSDLAEALRDSDDIKKQRNEASKELKELREKIEVQMEKESSRTKPLNSISHNHSHDSAIDTDLQEWETETIAVEIGITDVNEDDIGFELSGGKDDPQYPDSGIFVSSISKGSVADGKLKLHDTILQINNVDMTNCNKSKAWEVIRSGNRFLSLIVRRRHSSRFIQSVQLQLGDNKEHGLVLESGLYISRIAPGSVAAKEGNLAIGDRIININGKTLDGTASSAEAMELLSPGKDGFVIAVAKCYANNVPFNNVDVVDSDRSSTKELLPRTTPTRESVKKLSNSSAQTDNTTVSPKRLSSGLQSKFLDRAYHKLFPERRSAKERSSEKKSLSVNSSPSPVHEEEVMAHLDSVIDHFRKNSSGSQSSKSKGRRRKEKSQDKNNGGTWPRYRATAPSFEYIEHCVGTVFNPSKRKERKSIASLMNNSSKMGVKSPTDDKSSYSILSRCSQSKTDSVSLGQSVNGDSFLSSPKQSPVQSPFRPPSNSGSIHYSTASSLDYPLDYSVVSANKDVLEYYHRNKVKVRPKSSHYPQSDSESFSAADSPVPQKPSSLDLPSLYGKHPPLHLSSGSMSSGIGMRTTKIPFGGGGERMSPRLSDRSQNPIHSQMQSYLRSPPSSLTYFPVSSGRILHTHVSHPHPHSPTSSSPKYSSRSGESLVGPTILESAANVRHYHRFDGRYSLNPSSSSSPHSFSHSPSQSADLHHYHISGKHHFPAKHNHHSQYREDLEGYSSYDGPSTFPKRVHQRTRLPSNQSVTSKLSAGKVSTSSIDKSSESTNLLPTFHVGGITPRANPAASSMPDFRKKKLGAGAREINIQKSAEPLGIQIDCGPHGGIFVSSVSENSLAAHAGLQIGDQLLEVCGINMRSATYLHAANVLRQCTDSITMLVQYSPDKYKEALEMTASSSSSSSSSSRSSAGSAATPTPSSSPKTPKNDIVGSDDNISPSASSTLTRPTKSSGQSSAEDHVNGGPHDPRRVFLKKCSSNFGVSLLGGNAVGIFVHAVQDDSPASGPNGLRCGDQILEYNGVDLRSATAEQAASELAKPAEMISILAQYNYARYLEIQDQPGDSFYIRTMFDRVAESPEELNFRKDDILFVDNTMLNGISGMWRAWLVNEDGQKRKWGIIPSKYKVDEELLMKRSLGDLDSDSSSRRGNTSARRSFFRRKKHQRSNSRDSKELASYSDISINSYGETMSSLDEPPIPSYLRVERLDYLVLRPVVILGPLIEAVVDKLVQDFPNKFQRCIPEAIRGSPQTVERGIQDNTLIDYRRRGSHFECITVAAVKEICDMNTHCIVDVSPQSVERLHQQQIYPIVLFIKFKSTKQIREVKDSTFLTEKVSTKAAKEMYEHSLKMENEYKHLISAVIPGGSLAYLCAQIKACVDQEQSKTLWVRASGTV